jgi:hypothetical protein
MSFPSAIPRQVALQQSLPPLHRLETILNNQCCRTMILRRTATTPLTPCLSPRVHSNCPFPGTPSPKTKLGRLHKSLDTPHNPIPAFRASLLLLTRRTTLKESLSHLSVALPGM